MKKRRRNDLVLSSKHILIVEESTRRMKAPHHWKPNNGRLNHNSVNIMATSEVALYTLLSL